MTVKGRRSRLDPVVIPDLIRDGSLFAVKTKWLKKVFYFFC
jgi:hypothetical protein